MYLRLLDTFHKYILIIFHSTIFFHKLFPYSPLQIPLDTHYFKKKKKNRHFILFVESEIRTGGMSGLKGDKWRWGQRIVGSIRLREDGRGAVTCSNSLQEIQTGRRQYNRLLQECHRLFVKLSYNDELPLRHV